MSADIERPSSPRFTLLMGAVVAGSLVGGALLAPAVAVLLGVLPPDASPPFSRVYDRVAIGLLLVALIVLRRRLGLGRIADSWRAESWRQRVRRAAAGLALSLVPALLVLGAAIDSSRLLWAGKTAFQAAEKMAVAVPSALVIGLAEESFFRVVVFGGLAATWRWPVAAVGSSAMYSVVHFLTPQRSFEIGGASPLEGLRYLGVVFGRLADPDTLPAVLGLFLIGLVLCLALQRKRSLSLVIGLHAGWLLAAKAAIRLTSLPPELADGGSLVKRQLLIGSPWLWLAVAVTALLIVVAVRPDRAASTPSRL